MKEKRHHQRVKTSNLVSYICLDEEGNEMGDGIGNTLNISLGGTLLETYMPVETEKILLTAMGAEEDPIEIRGLVVYSRIGQNGTYLTGIRFSDTKERQINAVKGFIRDYARQKRNGGR
jgi:hypothetical protein